MPDTAAPATDKRSPLQLLMQSAVETLRAKLEEEPTPYLFDEVSVFASSFHKACSALDPIVNVPRSAPGPLASAPQVEGSATRSVRELVEALQKLATPREPKQSRKDIMAAIVVAERAGLDEDAERLREELYEDEPESMPEDDEKLPPKLRVERAEDLLKKSKEMMDESNALTERAKSLLASVKPEQIIDDVDEA